MSGNVSFRGELGKSQVMAQMLPATGEVGSQNAPAAGWQLMQGAGLLQILFRKVLLLSPDFSLLPNPLPPRKKSVPAEVKLETKRRQRWRGRRRMSRSRRAAVLPPTPCIAWATALLLRGAVISGAVTNTMGGSR